MFKGQRSVVCKECICLGVSQKVGHSKIKEGLDRAVVAFSLSCYSQDRDLV